mmetsp:Transcript_61872/g.139424  ORF Transcript_61872/g.139424 Transcript_61872/m.139424 type:complete len:219 (+) Transcript_61872:257-913(+)
MNSMPLTSPSIMTRSRASGACPTKRRFFPNRPDQKNGVVVNGWYRPSMFFCRDSPLLRRNVPVLDPDSRSSLKRRIAAHVTRCEEAGHRLRGEERIHNDGAVLVEGDALHETRVGQHTRSDDDRVCGQDLAVLQLHAVHCIVSAEQAHLCTAVPLHALLLQQACKGGTHFLPENSLEGHSLHGDNGNIASLLLERGCDLHPDERATDYDHLLPLARKS